MIISIADGLFVGKLINLPPPACYFIQQQQAIHIPIQIIGDSAISTKIITKNICLKKVRVK